MCVMNAWTDRTEGLNSRSAWTSWQRPHRELSADAVSTLRSDMFTTLSHRITHFLRCPRVILLEAFRQLAQQHADTQQCVQPCKTVKTHSDCCCGEKWSHFATNVFILGWCPWWIWFILLIKTREYKFVWFVPCLATINILVRKM